MTCVAALALVSACDGPNEKAGKKADAAAGIEGGLLGSGPNQKVGEIRDRTERDRKKAVEARADSAEDRADEIRTTGDQRTDALERQASEIRRSAKLSGKALEGQAEAIRRE